MRKNSPITANGLKSDKKERKNDAFQKIDCADSGLLPAFRLRRYIVRGREQTGKQSGNDDNSHGNDRKNIHNRSYNHFREKGETGNDTDKG